MSDNIEAMKAKQQLEAIGYICEWRTNNAKADGILVKIADRIVSVLDIRNGMIDVAQMQMLLSDAMQKKARKGNRKK